MANIQAKLTRLDGSVIDLTGDVIDVAKALDMLTRPADPVFIPYFNAQECQHDYPNPWHGVIPPSCKKCGKQAYTITFSDNVAGPV